MPHTAPDTPEQTPSPTDHATRPADEETEHVSLAQSLKILVGASRGFWLVNLVNLGDGMAYFGFLSLIALFLEHDAGLSTEMSTSATSTFTALVTLFMALGAGVLSDRLGSRRALGLSMLIVLVGRIGLTLAPELGPQWLVTTGVWGALVVYAFGEAVIQPAMYAGVKEYADKRTATMAFALLYSIMNLGSVIAHAVSPAVRETWAHVVEGVNVKESPTAGITGSFWFFIGVTALILLLHLVLFTRKVEARDKVVDAEEAEEEAAERRALEETGEGQRRHDSGEIFDAAQPRGATGDAAAGGQPAGLVARMRTGLQNLPLRDARFMFFIFILLPVRTLFAHQWLTMPLYVTRAFPPEVGAKWEWLAGLNPFIIVVFVPLFAALTRKRDVVDMMIAGTLVTALSTFMLVPGPILPLLVAYILVFSLGESVWSSRFLEYVADIAPAKRVGIYMGFASLPWFLAKAVTGFYSGAMIDVFVPKTGAQNPAMLWTLYGLIALVSPVGLLLARRWLRAGGHTGGKP